MDQVTIIEKARERYNQRVIAKAKRRYAQRKEKAVDPRTVILAQPFKMLGKDAIKTLHFVFALSLDLRWFNPDEAKVVLNYGLDNGLLLQENDNIQPGFDCSMVVKPKGFVPSFDVFTGD